MLCPGEAIMKVGSRPSVGGKARIGYEKYLYGALGALGIGIGRAAVKNATDDD